MTDMSVPPTSEERYTKSDDLTEEEEEMTFGISWTSGRIVATLAVALAAALAVTVLIANQASASGGDRGGVARPADLANCFATGIDAIGRGDFDGGLELWKDCFTDDYSFVFTFFPGGPSITCPGPGCPIQEFDSRAELRARFAAEEFARRGYLATQHQMLNVDVVSRDGRNAEVFAYIQANHFLPDNSVDIFWGDYTIQAVRQQGRWRVQSEEILGTSFLNFQGAPTG